MSIDDLTGFTESGVVVPDEEAKPGDVVVSRSVVSAVEPIEGREFAAAGEAQLRNISVLVELFTARRSRID